MSDNNRAVSIPKPKPPVYMAAYTKVYVMGDTKFGQLGFQLPNSTSDEATDFDEKSNPAVIGLPKMCSYNILVK